MAGTHYGALNFTLEEERPKVSPMRKAGAVGAVVVAVCVMFFAGRVHKSATTPFAHSDVMDVASTCGAGQFIGECKKCQSCQPYEYNNGGCTYFKDTFCSYCDPIAHCSRTQHVCTSPKDKTQSKKTSTCKVCDCDKPITNREQKTLEQIEYYRRSWSAKLQKKYPDPSKKSSTWSRAQKNLVFSCFFNRGQPWSAAAKNTNAKVPATECRACTVCPLNYFQLSACNPKKFADTVCAPCTVCKEFQYTKTPCKYAANTVCASCINCKVESEKKSKFLYEKQACTSNLNRDVYKKGNEGKCVACDAKVNGNQYIKKACKPGLYKRMKASMMVGGGSRTNTKYTKSTQEGWKLIQKGQDLVKETCGKCPMGFYISSGCKGGIAKKCAKGINNKFVFDYKNQKGNCGQFKVGQKHICTPCTKNAGCDAKQGGEVCPTGQYLDKQSKLQKFAYRTKKCTPTVGGDALYGNCKKCAVHQYEKRQCAAQCVNRFQTGRCSNFKGGKWTTKGGKKCTSDKQCGKGYCKGLCDVISLKNGKKMYGSNEDGKMAKNKRGVDTFCSNCPNRFVYGRDENDKPLFGFSKGMASRCKVEDKICNYASDWQKSPVDGKGMKAEPAYSTCTGKCTVSKDSDKPIVQKQKFDNCCFAAKGKPAALGPSCEWAPTLKQCRTPFMSDGRMKGLPYRKRTKKTGSYKGFRKKGLTPEGRRFPLKNDGPHNFVRWCKQLCEDFPGCTMFQVERCLIDGTCKVKDSTECDLFNISDEDRNNDHAAPLDKDLLKKMILKDPSKGGIAENDWTCAMGAAVRANHRNASPAWNTAGFECKGADKSGIKLLDFKVVDGVKVASDAKCGTPMCQGAEKTCCVQNKHVCYSKPAQMRAHQSK
jgi:hypothetical protein